MQEKKAEHIRICLEREVESGATGFERFRFIHNALPEIDFRKIDTSTEFLGKKLLAPIMISSMTGGTPEGGRINQNLAKAAQKTKIALALGSQRIAIESPRLASTFKVRKYAKDIVILANIGAVQLNYGFGLKECQRAIKMIGADGIIFHLNPLQEAIQTEGDKNLSKLNGKIKSIAQKLNYPIIVKEVGGGISYQTAKKLNQAGIKIIDVAGWGGTNWAIIEGLRSKNKEIGQIFSNWGIPTMESIIQCKKIKGLQIIASGGIRTGIDIAKAISLGANLAGLAKPFLEPGLKSSKAVEDKINSLIYQLKIAMFCVGARNITQLKKIKLIKVN
ncbi:MAG: type 2 isopentenyl-diphosphate Delta-isomerase [Patescibacteria group bacterium]